MSASCEHPDPTPDAPHNYVSRVEEFLARQPTPLTPGTLHHVGILHDDWCGVHHGRRCHCEPEVGWMEDLEGKN